MTEPLVEARAAYARQRWSSAVEGFAAADATDPLDIPDLERFAAAAQLVGEDELAAQAWERAHLELLKRGDIDRAVLCAFWCAFGLMNVDQMARAGGWLSRATRLSNDNDLESAAQGFLLVPAALRTLEGGDPKGALAMFEEVLAVGQHFEELDLIALGRLGQGRSLVLMGRTTEGLALLDEAMVSVTAGELTPIIAGRIYCAVILVCQQAFDLDRAHEWTAALSRWCDSQPDIVPFRGQCLVHRSEVLQLQGDWAKAMDEAERARDRLSSPPGQSGTGMAFYQLGELYRLKGAFAEAEAAYREAKGYGRVPEPGVSWMRFMQGDLDAAVAGVRRAMADSVDRVTRAKVLSACVEIMFAADDPASAEAAGGELAVIAKEIDAPVLHAMASHAESILALHRGEARAALDAAHVAGARWAQLAVPYERARSHAVAAQASLALGDHDTAHFEAALARQTFEALGALPDLDRIDAVLPSPAPPDSAELTPRQIEVVALVAAGKTNRQIADELYISEHTVRRHLQNIFNRIDITTRAAATAYAYEHGLI